MPDLPARPQIADSLLDLIGDTPLLRLNRVTEGLSCTVAVKMEMLNPGGSVKDRPALTMIEAAEREGLLKPGGTIVEPTSGNTGVGLAIVAAQRATTASSSSPTRWRRRRSTCWRPTGPG